MYHVHQLALRELGIEISVSGLQRAFDCPCASVKKALRNELEPPKPRGRHNALPHDSEAEADMLA
jgi:hypothetical protein